MPSSPKPRLVGISGSLRKNSYCTAVLATLADAIADRAALEIVSLDRLPFYNQDLDTETPPSAVADFRRALMLADGIVMVSPEFNYGVPGVIKNAIDWASRPYGRAALTRKPVLTATASPAFTGGVRAHVQLSEALRACFSVMPARPDIIIGGVHEKIRNGRLEDRATIEFLTAGINDLLAEISAHQIIRL
jgi:chromate reductase